MYINTHEFVTAAHSPSTWEGKAGGQQVQDHLLSNYYLNSILPSNLQNGNILSVSFLHHQLYGLCLLSEHSPYQMPGFHKAEYER